MATCRFHGARNGDLSVATNYEGGAAPGAGDTLILANSARDLSPQDISADTLAALIVEESFTGNAGEGNQYLIAAATSVIYRGQGSAFRLDLTTVHSTCRVEKTAAAGVAGLPPLLLKANKDTTDFYIVGGSAGIGVIEAAEAPVFDRLYVGAEGALLTPSVVVAKGATGNNLFVASGQADYYGVLEDLDIWGGVAVLNTDDALGVVSVRGGILYPDRHGTISELSMQAGLTDFLRTELPRTVTLATIEKTAELRKGPSVTFTGGLTFGGRVQLAISEL